MHYDDDSAADFDRDLVTRAGEPDMSDVLPPGSVIRKLWIGESDAFRKHLLRLDGESRRNRFGSAVSDSYIRRHAGRAFTLGTIIHGFFVDGGLRGASELRMAPPSIA